MYRMKPLPLFTKGLLKTDNAEIRLYSQSDTEATRAQKDLHRQVKENSRTTQTRGRIKAATNTDPQADWGKIMDKA